jgi:hypothetical protein
MGNGKYLLRQVRPTRERTSVLKTNIILNCCIMSSPRRKCAINSNLQNEFTFIKSTLISPQIVYCEICKTEFYISNSGHSNITNRIKKTKTSSSLKCC